MTEAVAELDPPIPRRDLVRLLKDVAPLGRTVGRRGKPAKVYPIDEVLRLHAQWVRRRGQ